MNPAHPNIHHIFDLVRNAINRQQPDEAVELIRSIRSDVESAGSNPLAAEYRLLLAEAYAAKGDPAADSFFAEARDLVSNLEERRPDLEMRLDEHLADYLVRFAGRPSAAREHFEAARKIAVDQRLLEDSARIQMKLLHIAVKTDGDEGALENFRTFKRIAHEGHFTNQVQLAAWHQIEGQANTFQRGLRFARKKEIVPGEFYRRILQSVRDTSA